MGIRPWSLHVAAASPLVLLSLSPCLLEACASSNDSMPGVDASPDVPVDAIPDGAPDGAPEAGQDVSAPSDGGDAGPPTTFTVVVGSCKLLWWIAGDKVGRRLGTQALAIDDLDGDGARDVLIGSYDVDSHGASSILEARSGKDGHLLRAMPVQGTILEPALIEDVDGDGVREFAVGSTFPSSAIFGDGGVSMSADAGPSKPTVLDVISPKTGNPVSQTMAPSDEPWFGGSVAAYSSTLPGLIVGSPEPNPFPDSTGLVHLTTTTGSVVRTLTPPAQATFGFGACALQTKDLNDDGVADTLVGDPGVDTHTGSGAGRLWALSGKDDSLLWQVPGEAFDLLGGNFIAPGDLNGDGIADVVVGVPEHVTGCGDVAGEVLALSGKTGNVLWNTEGQATRCGEGLGGPPGGLRAMTDLNGDGVADILAGAPSFGSTPILGMAGRFVVLNGKDGTTLVDIESNVPINAPASDAFGLQVDDMGDLDGEGHSDVVVTAPQTSPGGLEQAGLVTAWSCRP